MEFVPQATRFVDLAPHFEMRCGGVLHGARVGYETFGQLRSDHANVLLILTGLSPDAHAASHAEDPSGGWWEDMVGPEKPIDTNQWYVVCVNSLGSCKGSTGPSSTDPVTGEPYRLDFPDLAVEDIADAAAFTVRALGFSSIACVIGTSMGGMSALALLSRHPGLVRSLVNISGGVESLPFSIAIRSLQREAIRTDPGWNNGRYDEEVYPYRGMLHARKLGMITYRSAREWDVRFGRTPLAPEHPDAAEPFGPEFKVEGYLERHARHFARRFDPNSYLYLSRCIDRFDLGASHGTTAVKVLAGFDVEKALVVGVQSDILFPLHQQQQIANGLGAGGTDVQFLALESAEGHDAFLVDTKRFGPPLSKFLMDL